MASNASSDTAVDIGIEGGVGPRSSSPIEMTVIGSFGESVADKAHASKLSKPAFSVRWLSGDKPIQPREYPANAFRMCAVGQSVGRRSRPSDRLTH